MILVEVNYLIIDTVKAQAHTHHRFQTGLNLHRARRT